MVDDHAESGRPMPPPMPKIALIIASPPATCSRGKVSRTIPKASGKTPPRDALQHAAGDHHLDRAARAR